MIQVKPFNIGQWLKVLLLTCLLVPISALAQSTEFFDDINLYGFIIPGGWLKDNSSPDFAMRVRKGDGYFGVIVNPPNDMTSAVNNAKILLTQQLGATIISEGPYTLSNFKATSLEFSDQNGGQGVIMVCPTASRTFFIIAEVGANLVNDPTINNDVEAMLRSFLIRWIQ